MRISDWSSDVCSSDLEWVACGSIGLYRETPFPLTQAKAPKPSVSAGLPSTPPVLPTNPETLDPEQCAPHGATQKGQVLGQQQQAEWQHPQAKIGRAHV